MRSASRLAKALALAPLALCLAAGAVTEITGKGVTVVEKTECIKHPQLGRKICSTNKKYDCHDTDQDGVCDKSVKRTPAPRPPQQLR